MLGRRIAARPRPPATVRDLEIALLEEWNSIPQSLIDNLIASMANSAMDHYPTTQKRPVGHRMSITVLDHLDQFALMFFHQLTPKSFNHFSTLSVHLVLRLHLSLWSLESFFFTIFSSLYRNTSPRHLIWEALITFTMLGSLYFD
ncbi:hypothetical protein TNCV_1836581 [Trichonephila clavipes]|nr:hypothetical protein TNCV_1836581 [Trichonephila clavipes]